MLTHPTLDQLNQLGLFGMASAFGEVVASGDPAALPSVSQSYGTCEIQK